MKTCPKCAAPMVGRAVKRTGRPYFGCSRYPACKGKLAIERKSNVLGDPEDVHQGSAISITAEEWGALRSCADDDAPPTEGSFPESVYQSLVARGLMRERAGVAPGGGRAVFFLTTPEGALAAGMRLCRLDVDHQGPCARVQGHAGRCMTRAVPSNTADTNGEQRT